MTNSNFTKQNILCIRDLAGVFSKKELSSVYNTSIEVIQAIQSDRTYIWAKPEPPLKKGEHPLYPNWEAQELPKDLIIKQNFNHYPNSKLKEKIYRKIKYTENSHQ